jgi:hypothetical protein
VRSEEVEAIEDCSSVSFVFSSSFAIAHDDVFHHVNRKKGRRNTQTDLSIDRLARPYYHEGIDKRVTRVMMAIARRWRSDALKCLLIDSTL